MTLSLPPLSDPGQKFPLLWIERVVFRDPAATSVITALRRGRRRQADGHAGREPARLDPAEPAGAAGPKRELGQAFTLLLPQLRHAG